MKGLFIFDTESDGLCGKSIPEEDHMTKFHVLLFKEYGKDNWKIFLDKQHPEYDEALKFVTGKEVNLTVLDLKEFNNWVVEEPTAIACQNLEGFDMKAFEFGLGTKYDKIPKELINGKPIRVYDTLSMSRGLHPDRPLPRGCPAKVKNPNGGKAKTIGPHSLEAWGVKVANLKVAIEDWKGLPLWKYCDRVWEDVLINELQWMHLVKEMSDGKQLGVTWTNALRRNLQADHLMAVQEEQGVVFDEGKAWELLHKCDAMMKTIEESVEPKLPLKDVPESRVPNFPKNPFGKDGEIGHHGWSYARKILGYKLNEEYFEHISPPKTSFKKDGTLSAVGYKYCVKMGVEDQDKMPAFIRAQLKKTNTLRPLSEDEEVKLRKQLTEKYMPEELFKEPMRLSNQDDIKQWLVKEGGWVPTLFRTVNKTVDDNKKSLPEFEIREKVWEYIQDKKTSIYIKYINQEMGINLSKITSENHRDFDKVVRKARFLVTSPKLKDERGELCPNLERIDGDMAREIVKWLSLRNRRSVLKAFDETKTTGWLNHPRLKIDGKLPARYSGLTNTNRRKHSIVCNVASSGALLGYEMRDLFTVPKDFWQIGVDGSNLEGMVAAWAAYEFDGGEYLRIMESGDAHSRNAENYTKASGQEVSRQGGKGITYGIMYGAGAAKIAVMLGVSKEVGQKVIDAFWDGNIGLKKRKEYLEKQWEASGKKFIVGFDGRKIWTRSRHSLLNCLLQSGGSLGMDLAGVIWHRNAKAEGLLDKGVARTIYYHKQHCGFIQ